MDFRAQGLQRIALITVLFSLAAWLVSCGSSRPSTAASTSGLKFRAFAAQNVSVGPSTAFPGGVAAGIFIIDAKLDVVSPKFINSGTFAWAPDLLFLAPNKKITLAYSSADNSVAIVNNASESAGGSIPLTGSTESIAVSPDAAFGFAAVNNAPIAGVAPGALEVMDLNVGNIPVTIPIPNAHFVAESHNGNRLLVFGDNSNSATLINTANIPPCTGICGGPSPALCSTPSSVPVISCSIPGFDHPVGALFSSDDNTAYVLNCGPECGGTAASIQAVDLVSQSPIGSPIPVQAATTALLNGSTLYVAGTPKAPGNSCGSSTAATTCGRLDVVNLNTRTVTNSQVITDGYHNRIDLSQNGQLFVGARNCTNLSTGGEVRGCLSIFNTLSPSIVIPPANGDVTGLQAIANRDVVYVVQNGELHIYDTTTDKLGATQIDLNGQITDVKLVDF
ncbi:MAG TPA: hypothetical protein VFJ47_11295 [Terriglobales bacterium]|nr:hypothetical protein [Terriglobales bacterium]